MATYNGTSGNDTYTGGVDADSILGNAGNDTLRGGSGNDTILGGAGNDTLYGDDGDDSILGGTGYDRFVGGRGNDFFDGGVIVDRSAYTDRNDFDYRDSMFDAAGVVIDLRGISGDGSFGFGTVVKGGGLGIDTIANVDFIFASNGSDRILLGNALIFENVDGTLGNDTIDGGAVQNSFFHGNTNRLSYGSITGPVTIDLRAGTVLKPGGTDTVSNFTQARGSPQDDQIYGSDDPIRHEEFDGRAGDDLIDGRGGFDMIRYDLLGVGVTIRLGTAEPQADGLGAFDTLRNIEGLIGSEHADTFFGDALANRLEGRGGNDTLHGEAGHDTLDGGSGTDTASFAAAPAGVRADLTLGAAIGGAGDDLLSNIENLTGSAFDDTLIGSSAANTLSGGAGDDSISGGGGFDVLSGNAGNDTLDGGAITDRHNMVDSNTADYSGAAGALQVTLGGVNADGSIGIGTAQDGDGGTDALRWIVSVVGSSGNDRLVGSAEGQLYEFLRGGPGDDMLIGGVPDDPLDIKGTRASYGDAPSAVQVDLQAGTATGGAGNDTLVNITAIAGSGHDDQLLGRTGNLIQHFIPNAGNDTVNGRGSADTVRYSGAPAGANVDLQAGTAQDGFGETDTLIGIEGVVGSSHADTLRGSVGSETFQGAQGNDSIDGRGGDDWVWFTFSAAAVNVTLPGDGIGSASGTDIGTDTLVSIEAVRGSPFNDTITGSDALGETIEGYEGSDTIDGRGGSDTASFDRSFDTGAVVDLAAGVASNDGFGDRDLLIGIENVIGTRIYADHISGSDGDNLLRGQGGNDTLIGLGGNDTLEPGTGTDSVDGGGGADLLRLAGAGAAYMVSRPTDDTVRLVNNATQEDVSFTNVEQVAFSDGTVTIAALLGLTGATPLADVISGPNDAAWTIDGLAGNDSITSVFFFANDSLAGGAGDDTIAANRANGAGADTVNGGNGIDTLLLVTTRNQYGFTELGAGVVQAFNGNTNERVQFSDIEFVAFSDVTVTVGNLFSANNLATEYADSITGTAGHDSIDALTGHDTVRAGDGDDTLAGGFGTDVLDGGSGSDRVSYAGASAAVQVDLGAGTTAGGSGGDRLISIEHASGSPFDDLIIGNDGENTIDGLGGNDTLRGGGGETNDLNGGAGNDSLAGGAGDENYLTGGPGNDTLDGNGGASYALYYDSTGSVMVNLATGIASDGLGGTDTLISISGASDGEGNDTLIGNAADNAFALTQGNDSLDGGAGFDTLYFDDDEQVFNFVVVNLAAGTASGPNTGNDTLTGIEAVWGSLFNDTLIGSDGGNLLGGSAGNDSLAGGLGDDTLIGDDGSDTLDGGGGSDWLDHAEYGFAISVNLANGVNSLGDTLISIENVRGGAGHDTIVGDDGNNQLEGGGGNDSLAGGAGDDTLDGDFGNDTVDGGPGSDWIDWSGSGSAASINLASGANNGGDTLIDIENLIGTRFNDTLTGSSGANMFLGGAGNDNLIGAEGNDSLAGGDGGFDSLEGGAGNDTLDGGAILNRHITDDANNFARYSNDPAGIRWDSRGMTGDGNTGSFTVVDGWGNTDTLTRINLMSGSHYDDTITGSAAMIFEQFEGNGGNDTIDGGPIHDPIFNRRANRANYGNAPGAVQVDLAAGTAQGAAGNDTLININMVRGSASSDSLAGSDFALNSEQFEGGGGSDTIDGRGGEDIARYDNAPSGIDANLVAGVVQDGYGYVDSIFNIEGLRGSAHADRMTGGNPANGTTAEGSRRSDGKERFLGNAGNDTIDGGQGFDWVDYFTAPAGVVVNLATGTASDGQGGTDTLLNIEAVLASRYADHITGSAGFYELFNGLDGNDTIAGGDGRDVLDHRNDEGAVNANLATGVVLDGFGGTDSVSGIEAIFGSLFSDTLRGADQAANLRGETLRGGEGNDTLDGGAGVDTAEFLGNRLDYTFTQVSASSWTVRDNVTSDGDDGTDTLAHIERLVFGDQMLAFGTRAEEVARVAAILWSKDIIVISPALFARGMSFYDVGYDFQTLCATALQFWRDDSDARLVQRILDNSGSTKTAAQLLQTIATNGGANTVSGRAAALVEIAMDTATDALIEQSGIRTTGLVAENLVPGFGYLFDPIGG